MVDFTLTSFPFDKRHNSNPENIYVVKPLKEPQNQPLLLFDLGNV